MKAASPSLELARQSPSRPVFWLLWGDKSVASSRFQGYLIHKHLVRLGHPSFLLLAPSRKVHDVPWPEESHWEIAALVDSGIAIFQKLGGFLTEHLVGVLREFGATTVFVQADYDVDNQVPFRCDIVVACSEYLARFYREAGAKNVAYIPDPVDFWCKHSAAGRRSQRTHHLRVCWNGHRDNWDALTLVREILREPEFADMRLTTVSNHPEADVRWSIRNLRNAMNQCDLGIVPVSRGPEASSKSGNRVVQFMAAGIPVVAGRIPAYEEVIRNGWNGFLADSAEEYREALRALRDPETRRLIAARAHELARKEFSLEAIGREWLNLFDSLPKREDTKERHGIGVAQNASRLLSKLALRAKLNLGIHSIVNREYLSAAKDFAGTFPTVAAHPGVLGEYLPMCSRAALRIKDRIIRRAKN